ncbi:ABC transporter substrate-binding protein [Oceaniglobus trochenteri]|uniref:ABC transporter substrate-binding protein n=1 Tax=Oceaniglobus trochenteri TaxID=2763260 RepID=UPI001CFFB2CA|nr:extracellular solute-binding protein [Oceaniglobus trochenteri]
MTALLRLVLCALLALLPVQATAQEATVRIGGGDTAFLMRSTTDIAIIRPVIERFAERNPELAITYEQWGSNALFARTREDCRGDGPGADAVFSSAVQQMVWLVNAACAQPHRSAATLALPATRRWRDELWGVTTEPAVIVYNKRLLRADAVPQNRFALLDAMRARPEFYRRKIATYDIAASGLGYLFAYSDSLEATTFGGLMESFARIDAVATCCSAEIIAGVARGEYLIAYNVLGSYVSNAASPEVGVILPRDYTLFLSRAYLIPRKARRGEMAARLLDFLLSPEAQGLLLRAGLVTDLEDAETSLPPSARRAIPLSPALLVALDANRRALMLEFWRDTFEEDTLP